jgi:predicted lipoprotein with Yx(FWY)xxD motif
MTCAVALMAVLALAVAGCGSDSSSSGGAYGGSSGGDTSESSTASAETKPTPSAAGGDGIVSAAKAGDLGTVIVDSEGFTLYDFHKDKGGKSSCYGACAGAWPPLLTEGNPQAQGAAQRNLLGTTERTDGTLQVTYKGWPLYTFVGDKAPGEANGNDFSQFGAQWYALQPDGEEPED